MMNTDHKPFIRSYMTYQVPNYYDGLEIENPTWWVPSGYIQVKVALHTVYVIWSYYNTKPKVTFDYPQDSQTSCEKSDQKVQSFTKLDLHQDETSVTKCENFNHQNQ